jgi:D-cysteine desulfhydrase
MLLEAFNTTPIQALNENVNKNAFYIKRDDLFPISFGGNKARKATLFFKEQEKLGCDSIVTYGSSSSNHCRVIANIAASKNLPCYIITPNETIKNSFNSQMVNLYGAEVINCPVSEVKETINRCLSQLEAKGFKPYFIQGGGHGDLGTKAYVDAYNEIRGQEKELGIFFDYIFHTSGTGTTQAGLVCGQVLNKDTKQVIGISNARKNPYGGQVVLDSVNSYMASISEKQVSADVINFIDDYVLDGYGSYNDEILQILKEVLINDGIPLDTTYTAKGFWGMKKYVKKNQISGKNILFIHTGGTPLFFDDLGGIC